MIVKIDVIVYDLIASTNVLIFVLQIHSIFRIDKKFSDKALSYGFPRFDIDSVMLYD